MPLRAQVVAVLLSLAFIATVSGFGLGDFGKSYARCFTYQSEDSKGSVQCWGYNGYGNLGNDSSTTLGVGSYPLNSLSPINFNPNETEPCTMVAGTHWASCGIFGSGTKVKCWGSYGYGLNGLGESKRVSSTTSTSIPMSEANYIDLYNDPLVVPIDIKAGYRHICILYRRREIHRLSATGGYIQCWGYDNRQFMLGLNPYIGNYMGDNAGEMAVLKYVDMGWTADRQPVQITLGRDHTCALMVNKVIRCWGRNSYGQLGLGNKISMGYRYPVGGTSRRRLRSSSSYYAGTALSSMDFIEFRDDGEKPVYVTAGDFHNCALFTNERVRCWGRNNYGQLGQNSITTYGDLDWHMTWMPYITFADTSRIVDLACGYYHSCALFANGRIRCWGSNAKGALGLNSPSPPSLGSTTVSSQSMNTVSFISFSDGQPAVSITAGMYSTCGFFEFSAQQIRVRCWGDNGYGQLGTMDQTRRGTSASSSTTNLEYIPFNIGNNPRINFYRMDPSAGWRTGGTKVYLRGPHLYLAEAVVVQLTDINTGLSSIRTTVFEHTEEVSFIMPPWGLGGRESTDVSISISSNGFHFKETHLTYTYYELPEFKAKIQNGHYKGGTVVQFLNVSQLAEVWPPATCKFGPNPQQVSAATYNIKWEYLECKSPEITHPSGASTLSVSMNGIDYMDFPWTFHTIDSLTPIPNRGPISGRTEIRLFNPALTDLKDIIAVEWRTPARIISGTGTFVPATASVDAHILVVSKALDSGSASALVLPMVFDFFVSLNDGVDWISCDKYTYYRDPQVLAVIPETAPIQGGTPITVSGISFENLPGMKFRFNNETHFVYADANFQSLNGALVGTTPAIGGGGGSGKIEVSFNGEQYTTDAIQFSYIQIKELDPNGGPVTGGTEVRVIGVGFKFSLNIVCQWGTGFAGTTVGTYVSESIIKCTSPAAPSPNTIKLEIQTNSVDFTADNVDFTFYDPPVITSISPDRGPAAAGATLSTKLYGTGIVNLDPVRGIACQIGSTTTYGAILTDEDTGDAYVDCPIQNSVGVVPVLFAMNRLDFVTTGFTWTYFDVFGLVPDSGPTIGGTEIAVSGSGFGVIPGKDPVCKFGNTPVKAFVSSSAQVVCISPGSTPGIIDVKFSSDGETFSLSNVKYQFYQAPTVVTVEPASVAANGGTKVTLTGSYFRSDLSKTRCRFGRAEVPAIQYIPDPREKLTGIDYVEEKDLLHKVVCLAPPSSNPRVSVEISFNTGSHFTEDNVKISYFEATAAFPAQGPVTGGTLVTVTGIGFFHEFAAQTKCKFDISTPVAATILDGRRVQCLSTPANSTKNQNIDIRMTTNGDQYTVSTAPFYYYEVPQIASYAPQSGPAFSSEKIEVRIAGTGFQNLPGLNCRFGQLDSPTTTFISDSIVACDAPTGTGVVQLRLSMNMFDYQDVGDYTYFSVLSVIPNFGPKIGGTLISVIGRGFTSTTGLQCRIAGTVVPATYVHEGLLTCVSPILNGTYTPPTNASLRVLDARAGGYLALDSSLHRYSSYAGGVRVLQSNTTANATNTTTAAPPPPPPPDKADTSHLTPSWVAITTNGQFYSEAQSDDGKFVYYENPMITSISPRKGQTAGTDIIDVRGLRFSNSSLLGCRFGGAESSPVRAKFISATKIECTTSLHVVGSVVVRVTENEQEYYPSTLGASTDQVFTYEDCRPGLYAKDFKTVCRPCGNGTFAAKAGSTKCIDCQNDQYTLSEGSANCTDCPANTNIPGENRDARDQCQCREGFFHPDFITGEPCQDCPEGGACAGGVAVPLAQPGYWATPKDPILFMLCDLEVACIGGPPLSCRRGYEGRLCADCQDGFYKLNGICEVCPELAVWIIILFVVFASVICAMLVKMVGKNASAYGATVGIATYYFQVLAMLNKMDMQWPYVIRRVIEILTAPFTWNLDILAMECTFPVTYKSKWLIFLLMPLMFIFVFILFYLMKKFELWFQRRKKKLSPSFYNKNREIIPLNLDIYAAEGSEDDDFSDNDAGFEADDGGYSISGVYSGASSSELDDGGADFESDEIGHDTIQAQDRQGPYVRKVKMTSNRHKYEDPIATNRQETEEEAEKRIEDNQLLSFKNRLVNAYLLLLSLVYLVMVSTALELFDCTVRKDGIATLDVFPALECYQQWWWIFMPIGIIATIMYGVVLPSSYAFLVIHNRHRLATPIFIERYGSIYSEYKLTYAWWESVTMGHKLMMAMPLLYLTVYPDFQITAFLCVLFLGLTINIMVRPFYVERYNNLQNALRWCSCLMLMCGMIFRSGDFPHWSVEYVVIGTAFVLIGISCFGVFIVIVGDIVATQIALRRNVEARQMECLHTVMHTHGKTEIMMWLGSHRRGGINYQMTLCEILQCIADDYEQNRDSHGFTFVDMAPIDHFIDMYTGNSFMTPVVPFVRAWLLTRISAIQADDMHGTEAMEQFQNFVSTFSEFTNFVRLLHSKRIPLPPESKRDVAGGLFRELEADDPFADSAIDQELAERPEIAEEAMGVLRVLYADLLSQKMRISVWKQLEQGNESALTFLTRAVCNLPDMVNSRLGAVHFFCSAYLFKQAAMAEVDAMVNEQPLLPFLHIFYEDSFSDYAMYELAKQISGMQAAAGDYIDFQNNKRSAMHLLHEVFVLSRKPSGHYDTHAALTNIPPRAEVNMMKEAWSGVSGFFSSFTNQIQTVFDDDPEFYSPEQEAEAQARREALIEQREEEILLEALREKTWVDHTKKQAADQLDQTAAAVSTGVTTGFEWLSSSILGRFGGGAPGEVDPNGAGSSTEAGAGPSGSSDEPSLVDADLVSLELGGSNDDMPALNADVVDVAPSLDGDGSTLSGTETEQTLDDEASLASLE